MSNKPTLEELRENARTNYGVTNADDLDESTLKAEMKAIDKQAEDAKKEEAKVQRNPERATANSTAPSTNGASDGNSNAGNDQSEVDENEDESDENEDDEQETAEQLSKLSREELEGRAREVGVDGDPSDKEQYPNKDALVTAIEATRAGE